MPKIKLHLRKRGKRGGRRGTANVEEVPAPKRVFAIDNPPFKVRNLKGAVIYEGDLTGWYRIVQKRKELEVREVKRLKKGARQDRGALLPI